MVALFKKEIREGEIVYKVKNEDKLGLSRKLAQKLFDEVLDDAVVNYEEKYKGLKYRIEVEGAKEEELFSQWEDYKLKMADKYVFYSSIFSAAMVSYSIMSGSVASGTIKIGPDSFIMDMTLYMILFGMSGFSLLYALSKIMQIRKKLHAAKKVTLEAYKIE